MSQSSIVSTTVSQPQRESTTLNSPRAANPEITLPAPTRERGHTIQSVFSASPLPRSQTPCPLPQPTRRHLLHYLHLPFLRSIQPDTTSNNTNSQDPSALHKVRSTLSLRSLRSALSVRTIPISINPFSSPEISPIFQTGVSSLHLRSNVFASQEGGLDVSSGSQSGSRRQGRNLSRTRDLMGSRTHIGRANRRMEGTRICWMQPATLFWLYVMIGEAAIMSLMVAIGVVAADLRRGVAVGIMAWLGVSAIVAVLSLAWTLVLYVGETNRRMRWRQERLDIDVENNRRQGEASLDDGHQFDENTYYAAHTDRMGEPRGVDGYQFRQSLVMEGEGDRDISAARRRREQNDEDVLMMRRHSVPHLRIDTDLARNYSRARNPHGFSQLQEIIERDTNRYLQSPITQVQSSTEWPARTSSLTYQSSDVGNMGMRARKTAFDDLDKVIRSDSDIVQSQEQQQAYLEMRRQHFAAINRNHFLGLDHPVLNELTSRRCEQEDQRS